MSDDLENHTLRLMREMRDEMKASREEARKEFQHVHERLAALEVKTDGQSGQLSMIIGLLTNHTERLELLEGRDT